VIEFARFRTARRLFVHTENRERYARKRRVGNAPSGDRIWPVSDDDDSLETWHTLCQRCELKVVPQRTPRQTFRLREVAQVMRRSVFILAVMTLISCAGSAKAQGYYEFLGAPKVVPDKFSPRHGIRYNTQGYDQPDVNWTKRARKLERRGVPAFAVAEMMQFPGNPDTIGEWIDQAYDEVQAQFMKCGSLGSRASQVSPYGLYVIIMPSAFFEPYYKVDVAGVYYPSTRQIKVLNIYYTWDGPYVGWLRHARDLIKWELGNFFATELRVQAEPRPEGWPCNAPGR